MSIDNDLENVPLAPKPKRGGQPASKGIARNVRKQKKFLQVLKRTFNFSEAAKAINVAPSTVYAFMARCPEFNALVEEARMEAVHEGEAELYRRGIEGYEEAIVYKGEVTGSVTKKSDQLLMFFLRNNYPEKYTEKSQVDTNSKVEVEVSAAKSKLLQMLNVNPEDIIEGKFTEG